MKRILAFAGSTSSTSINKQLALHALNQCYACEQILLDLNALELPLFSVDLEKRDGIHPNAQAFKDMIESADGLIVSLAEHNGNFAAAFKNLMDWTSRLEGKLWQDKPMLLMATSPGGRGGQSVLEIAQNSFPRQGANVLASFSLPFFNTNFSAENGIHDAELNAQLLAHVKVFVDGINV